MNILEKYKARLNAKKSEEYDFMDYLDLCKENQLAYATIFERMLYAIGEPVIVDTREDERLSRIFMNRKIRIYPSFNDFYGIEDIADNIVSYFKHAAQGLEESRQILYLRGPVGGGKSTISEELKRISEHVPFYTLKAYNKDLNKWEISPIFESPLGFFNPYEDADILHNKYGIEQRYLNTFLSPWALKRLKESDNDPTKFKVVKMWPSMLDQIGVSSVKPGDENNQDISTLVGKINIRLLEMYDQNDPDAYSWSGGLNRTTQGIMEFVEMFKSPLKMLHPLLTSQQEGHYAGTEQIGAIPHRGAIISHSNHAEWEAFKNNKKNEAFLDRIYTVEVPYTLRYSEEIKIYEKLIRNSQLAAAPAAPATLEMMAQFSILTRLKEPENSQFYSKMKIYNGETMKDKDPNAKTLQELKDFAGIDEGLSGFSTRQAYKVLSKVYNFDSEEVAANPVHLMYLLEKQIYQERLQKEQEERWISFVKGILAPRYAEFIGDEIQKAYLEAYDEFGQNLFERYIHYADLWLQEQDYRNPETGEAFDREGLNEELEKIEKAAGIANPKNFRYDVVQHVLRTKANNQGVTPRWTSYEKLRVVLEKRMFANTEELLPVISFSKKSSAEEQQKHEDFVNRMMEKGYTKKQVRLLVEWWKRYKKHH